LLSGKEVCCPDGMVTHPAPGPAGCHPAAADGLETTAAVDFLAGLADGGPVLELAIGTGRVARPLAARGLAVAGVEASAELVALLRTRPGGAGLPVVLGDPADVGGRDRFRLAYLVSGMLADADRWAECFRHIARVLVPGGAFVVKALVPDPADFERDVREPGRHGMAEEGARLHRYDRAAQSLVRPTVTVFAGGTGPQPFGLHYLVPGQIDRLAGRAGLRLAARYADWHRRPFDTACTAHVSVYRL
jgi:SAM-dependent methyltransferase